MNIANEPMLAIVIGILIFLVPGVFKLFRGYVVDRRGSGSLGADALYYYPIR